MSKLTDAEVNDIIRTVKGDFQVEGIQISDKQVENMAKLLKEEKTFEELKKEIIEKYTE